MARITKRQLKEDKLISTTARLSIFLNEHWKEIASVIAGIVIFVGALSLYYSYVTGRNEKAARVLSEARTLFAEAESAMESEGKVESTIEKYENAKTKFQEVSQKSGHSYTNSEAMFYSAKCSYQLGEYDEAVSTFQNFVSKYPKSIFALYARKAIGQCYEQFGDDGSLRKAIQQYDELSRYPETYVTLKAFIDKGRCYEKLGEWEQAIAAHKIIMDKFKWNVQSAIQVRSKLLVQKARDVISKYEAVLGKSLSDSDFVRFVDEAALYEKEGQERWFEALKLLDKAIFSRKEYWSEASGEYGRMLQDASDTLRDYVDSSADVIRNISIGQKYQGQGDWDNALRYYRRAVDFDFLPGMDLFEEAQFRIDWINSVEKPRIAASHQEEQDTSDKTQDPK